MRRQILAALLAAMMPVVSLARAETYPSRPITVICPLPSGGPLRSWSLFAASLGQPSVIENIAGANGSMGSGRVARAAPDGYTLRLASAPEIPTADEAGLSKYYFSLWFALWAPKGTARTIVERVNNRVVSALAEPATQRKLADLGLDLPPREEQSPEALRALQETEIKRWWPVLKAANINVE